jgi:hypothetical protein
VVSISARNAWLKTFGACPATPSPGSARTAGTRTGSGTNDSIADFRFRIGDYKTEDRGQGTEDRGQKTEDRGQTKEDSG